MLLLLSSCTAGPGLEPLCSSAALLEAAQEEGGAAITGGTAPQLATSELPHCGDTAHCAKATSSLDSGTARDGTTTALLGNLIYSLTTLVLKNFFTIPILKLLSFTFKPFTFVLLVHSQLKEALLCHAVLQPWHKDPEAVRFPPCRPPTPVHEAVPPVLGVPVEAGETKSHIPKPLWSPGATGISADRPLHPHPSIPHRPLPRAVSLWPWNLSRDGDPPQCWAAGAVLTHLHSWERDW